MTRHPLPRATAACLLLCVGMAMAQRWLAKHSYKSVRLITNDWHMRRAAYEFRRVLGGKYEIVHDAVRTEPSFMTLFAEYNKYLLRRAAVWLDV